MHNISPYKVFILLAVICASAAQADPEPTLVALENDPQFHAQLLAAAQAYSAWPVASGSLGASVQWAFTDCADEPRPEPPLTPNVSRARGDGAHGGKLYLLFARDAPSYVGALYPRGQKPPEPQEAAPIGQVIVKEAWTSIPVEAEPALPQKLPNTPPTRVPTSDFIELPPVDLSAPIAQTPPAPRQDPYGRRLTPPPHPTGVWPYARDTQGKLYTTGEKAGLFIMIKTPPDTPNTDNGWVYGTVSADAKTVTSSGRVTLCMTCHQESPKDRLLGP